MLTLLARYPLLPGFPQQFAITLGGCKSLLSSLWSTFVLATDSASTSHPFPSGASSDVDQGWGVVAFGMHLKPCFKIAKIRDQNMTEEEEVSKEGGNGLIYCQTEQRAIWISDRGKCYSQERAKWELFCQVKEESWREMIVWDLDHNRSKRFCGHDSFLLPSPSCYFDQKKRHIS